MSTQRDNPVKWQASRVAAIQMVSTHDIAANLEEAARLLKEAADAGASIAVLPENFAVLATKQMIGCGRREAEPDNVIRQFLAQKTAELGIWVVGAHCPLRPGQTAPL